MAGNSSRTLKLIFAGDNRGAVQATKGLESGLGGLQGKLGGVSAGLAGVFSVGAITAFATKSEQAWAGTAGAVARFKRLTGASAEDASALAFYAQQAGIDATKAATGFQFLAKNIANGKVAAEGIKTIGEGGKLLPFDKILGNISEKFQSLPPGIQRTALVLKLFGRGGADMGKILAEGSDELAKQRAEMKALGLSFDKDGLAKFQKFINAQRDAQAAVTGLEVRLGSGLAPALTAVADGTTKVAEGFNGLRGPAKVAAEAAAGVAALTVAFAAAATAAGVVVPIFRQGRDILLRRTEATTAATAAELELTAADEQMAAGEAAATASQIAFNDAIAAGLPIEAASAEAAAARTAALEASTVATEEAAATSTGLAGALGPIALAAVAAGFAIKGLHDAFTGKQGSLKNTPLDPKVLGGTNAELVKAAQNIAKMERVSDRHIFAGQDLEVLKGMQKALRDAGEHSIPALDKAITDEEEAAARAARRHKELADKTDDAANASDRLARAAKKADDALSKKVGTAVDKAIAERDAEQGVIDAHQQRLDDEAALATAQQAAVGNSDDYRQALDDIASAEKDEVSAKADVLSTEKDLSQARVDAAKNLSDLTDATNKAAEAERDSVLAKHEAQAELRKVLADPRSSALDKEKATVGLADAEDNAKQAAKDHTQAILDENAAKRAGIEGDKDVVAAKGRVADAQDKVRESIDKVSDSQAAARKVLSDAATEAQADSEKVQADKATEAAAWFQLAKQTNDATGAALIYYALLKQMGADPALQALLAAALNGVNTALLSPNGQGELANGRPAPHAPGSPGAPATTTTGGGGLLGSSVTVNLYGDSRQNAKAAAAAVKKVHDDLWRGAR